MRHRFLPLFALVVLAASPVSAQDLFELVPAAPNVYLALARPQTIVNSNAVVIVLDDAVLVVDAHSKPSAALGLIRQIKALTPKPVRYVVASHFHFDHAQGTGAYLGAWPEGVELISSEATRENLERIGVVRVKAEIANLPDTISAIRRQLSAASTAEQRRALETRITDTEAYLTELRSMALALPTLTFDKNLILRRGGTVIYLLFLGRGHTSGDVVAYLPREKLVATGDLVHVWTPFMSDSYPYEWLKTLDELAKLDFDAMLPGHGPILKGKDTIRLWQEFIGAVMDETSKAVAEGLSQRQTVERVSPMLRTRFAARFPAGSLDDVQFSIRKAYSVIAFKSGG